MKCQRCGRTIEEEVQFCPFCGHKAEPQPAKEPAEEVVEQAPAEEAAPAPVEPVAAPEPEVAPEPEAPSAPEPVEVPVEAAEPAPAPEPEVPAAAAAAMPFAAASAPVATPAEPMVAPTEAFGTSASAANDSFFAPSSTVSDPFLAPSSTVSEPAASTAADPFLAPSSGTAGAEVGFDAPQAAPAEPVAAASEAAPFAAPAAAPAEPFAAPATPDLGAQPQDAFIPPQPQAPQGDFNQTQFNQPSQGAYVPPQTGQVPPAGFTPPQMAVPTATKPPLSERTWFIVLLLLFVWPVGLFLMWRKGCTWSTVAKVIVTVVVALLVIFNIWSVVSNNSSSSYTSSSTSTSQSTTSSSSSSSSSSSTSTTAPTTSTFDVEASDSYGNPSMYLCLGMSGADAVAWLESEGYEYDGFAEAWMNDDGLGWVAVKDAEATAYTESEVDNLAAAGTGDPVAYIYTVSGYDDTEEVLSGNSQCVVQDSETIDNVTVAVVYGPNMQQALVMIQNDDGDMNVVIFNKEAIEAGMVDDISGYSVGSSIEDVWKTLTGRSI